MLGLTELFRSILNLLFFKLIGDILDHPADDQGIELLLIGWNCEMLDHPADDPGISW